MNQGKNNINDFIVKTYYEHIDGIRTIISSTGLVDTDKKISSKAKEKILEAVSKSFENIPDGWFVEGEYKNNNFYVLYIINDKKEILDIEETVEWSKIFELCSPPHKNRIVGDIEKLKNIEIRPTRKFNEINLIKNFDKRGIETKRNWRTRVKEIFYDSISESKKQDKANKKI